MMRGGIKEPSVSDRASIRVLGPILFVVMAWGGNYTWIKIALNDGGALTFNALRYVLASAIIVSCLFFLRGRDGILPVRGERLSCALVGVLQIAVMTGGTTLAMLYIDASRTVLIAYSMPLWSLILSFVFLGERASRFMMLGLLVGFSGIAVLATPWSMDWTSSPELLGSAIALLATFGWASGSVLYRSRRWRSDFWQQVTGQLIGGAACSSIVAIVFETRATQVTNTYLSILLYNALVPTILGFFFWAKTLSRMSVAAASQFLLLSPLFGVLLSSVVLGEALAWSVAASAILIVTGALISYRR